MEEFSSARGGRVETVALRVGRHARTRIVFCSFLSCPQREPVGDSVDRLAILHLLKPLYEAKESGVLNWCGVSTFSSYGSACPARQQLYEMEAPRLDPRHQRNCSSVPKASISHHDEVPEIPACSPTPVRDPSSAYSSKLFATPRGSQSGTGPLPSSSMGMCPRGTHT